MRIAPLAVVLDPNLPFDRVLFYASECIVSSHVHPDSVDSTALFCFSILQILKNRNLDISDLLTLLLEKTESNANKTRLAALKSVFEDPQNSSDPFEVLHKITDYRFQIYACDALATVLYFFGRFQHLGPEKCMVECVKFGGDCDTTCAILGGLLGAKFGTQWIPVRWFGVLENGEHGRDYAVRKCDELLKFDKIQK
jgi:ADP-ribosylglycohydrolase